MTFCKSKNLTKKYGYVINFLPMLANWADHIYITKKLEENTKRYKLEINATDHLPIIAKVKRKEVKNKMDKVVLKRSRKNFTKEHWNINLARREWEKIGQTEGINKMANILNEQITQALEECEPMKELKIQKKLRTKRRNEKTNQRER